MRSNLKLVGGTDIREPERDVRTLQNVDALVQRITAQRDTMMSKKVQIEDRWLEDLRNYHGRYDPTIEAKLRANKESRLFVNQTRPKTKTWAARLGDMLFPADDQNFGVNPTPVPVLSRQLREAEQSAQGAAQSANMAVAAGDAGAEMQHVQAGQQAATQAQQMQAEIDAAKKAAENMQRTIEDQFIECDFTPRNRQVIMDACKLGTGIMKGPMAKHRVRQGWAKGDNGDYYLAHVTDPRPEYLRVDPWNWYPDMDATSVKEMEYCDEVHRLNQRELRRLSNVRGFDPEKLRNALERPPVDALPYQIVAVREITNNTIGLSEKKYNLWEHHGLVTPDELELLARYAGDGRALHGLEDDPLVEYNCLIWTLNSEMVKWSPNPLDSGDFLYSAYNFERDDACIFGFGVPYLMRDSQAALNAAWRMMMNNAALTVGPQVLVDKENCKPADGNYTIYARKVWNVTSGYMKETNVPLRTVDIPIRLQELERIITLASKFVDDETLMPPIAMGESASHVTRTAQGMAMLMNSVNVTFRSAVKNYDDQMTVPTVQRAYDWNMQFNKDESIKGDFDVQAKGSSVLLVRELEAQNLMVIARDFSAHPISGKLVKVAPIVRRLFKSHMLPPDELVKTDDEIKQEEAAAAANPPPDPEREKLQMQMQIAKGNNDTQLKVAQYDRETQLMIMAEKLNVSLETLKQKLTDSREGRDLKDRHLAVETVMAQKTGTSAGGEV